MIVQMRVEDDQAARLWALANVYGYTIHHMAQECLHKGLDYWEPPEADVFRAIYEAKILSRMAILKQLPPGSYLESNEELSPTR